VLVREWAKVQEVPREAVEAPMIRRKRPSSTTFDVASMSNTTVEDVDSGADRFIRAPGGVHGSTIRRVRHRVRGRLGWYAGATLVVAVVAAVADVVPLL
jgi:hypothetical protein